MPARWPFLVGLIALLLAACGGADPTPTASSAVPPTPTATTAPAPTPTTNSGADIGGEVGLVEGGCLPGGNVGVAPGDTWTMAGPVTVTGSFPGEIPEGATSMVVTYAVSGLEDGTWVLGPGGAREAGVTPVENLHVLAHSMIEWRDASGTVVQSDESELSGVTISVANLGVALTLDWACHQEAWMAEGFDDDSGSTGSTGERTLSTGETVVVFTIVSTLSQPDQGLEMSLERVVGYDKQTGRVALQEARTTGTFNGESFGLVMIQELVAGP